MKIVVIDINLSEPHIYNSRIGASKYLGVSSQTLRRWEKENQVKQFKGYIIGFNANVHKSTGKVRKTGF